MRILCYSLKKKLLFKKISPLKIGYNHRSNSLFNLFQRITIIHLICLLALIVSCSKVSIISDKYEGKWCRLVADGINPKAINNAYLRILKIDNTNLSVEYHNELYSIKEAELEGFKGTAIISDEYSLIVTVNDRKYLITIGESSKFGSYLSLYYGTQAIEISDGSFVKCN